VTPRLIARTSHIEEQQLAEFGQRFSLSALQAKIVAHRIQAIGTAVLADEQIEHIVLASLKNIAPPHLLKDGDKAVQRIALAIKKGETIGLLTDYDVDGITSHAILLHALRDFFAVPQSHIQHLIGHRIDDGYGISQGLVERILSFADDNETNSDYSRLPDLIISADCGSSDEKRIAQLKAKGIDVIVTDHHAIPQEGIPQSALATINPTREDCHYPDVTIAGCLVTWLLMSYLRTALINNAVINDNSPKLSSLLDYVALGTVADAVSLASPINRAVVKTGLQVMNQLKRPCWQVIKKLLDRDFQQFTAEDLGFQIGPRINARSRMSDPYMALHYLCATDFAKSMRYLQELDKDNQDRKATEKDMLEIAFVLAKKQLADRAWTLVIYHKAFHAGVQGIVASRLMEKFGRPAIVLSPMTETDKLTGSARTIPQVHIRKAIEYVSNAHPEIVLSFGGHKGAAGLKIDSQYVVQFGELFDQAVAQQLSSGANLQPVIYTDGELAEEELTFETIAELRHLEPYGREFEVPAFEGDFIVQSIRSIGADGTHLMMQLATHEHSFRAVWFRALEQKNDPFPFVEGESIHAAYQLKENYFRGNFSIQLHIIYASA